MNVEYYERLRELREDIDKSQGAIAEALGITQQQYSLYENGKRQLPLELLQKLCLLYGVSADYILGLPKHLKWPR